ncbi:HIT-like domain-containing protein [Coniella lustricola]|uniref:HIT-like domain-containing protein n=1 Tax=Coniella lustricola TaxID=2025994 RepID=A0A2T3AKQ8_9PEZI|nr:HIT-like domain-containing protein [Coniella lustricola]
MAVTPESLVPRFKLDRLLNQDQAGRRISLSGTIDDQPALLILERAPFPSSNDYLCSIAISLRTLKNLGANDIYHWYMASSGTINRLNKMVDSNGHDDHEFADLKINLIYPCTDQHIKKYSKQGVRFVTETPEIYHNHVRPYMQAKRDQGRLNWVFNIIEGRKEVEDVIFRTPLGQAGEEGFLLLPDLNWDRKTIETLHLLGIVERRDIWSLRDLKVKHLAWLQHMEAKFVQATAQVYPDIEPDQLKLYVHYQPTYYHFHIHIVHVALEAGATQATGKAIGLESIIEHLKSMGEDQEKGMDSVSLGYTLGEASELWAEVFGPLKTKGTVSQSPAPDH